ncbi:hypothetical protein F01_230036 [Burkholderia cenocepacia]|nr:hypothetical protein F01_230036 [Burkholderia cenocepacia]
MGQGMRGPRQARPDPEETDSEVRSRASREARRPVRHARALGRRPADFGAVRAVAVGAHRGRLSETRTAAGDPARRGQADRVRVVEAQDGIHPRSRAAFRVGGAARRQMDVDGRRGRDRGTHADPRHQPLDGRDVPDLQPVAAGRAAARRPGPDPCDQRQLLQRGTRHAQRGARGCGQLGAVAHRRDLVHVAQPRCARRRRLSVGYRVLNINS